MAVCCKMGKRLRVNPPFRTVHVRKYKRKCRADAIRSHRASRATSGTHLVAESYATPHPGKDSGDSLVPVHPFGSVMDSFYNSWPSKVTMKATGGQLPSNEEVSGRFPFCEPSV